MNDTERTFQDALAEVLGSGEAFAELEDFGDTEVTSVTTFEHAGVMTYNAGLVLEVVVDGERCTFQVTLVEA